MRKVLPSKGLPMTAGTLILGAAAATEAAEPPAKPTTFRKSRRDRFLFSDIFFSSNIFLYLNNQQYTSFTILFRGTSFVKSVV